MMNLLNKVAMLLFASFFATNSMNAQGMGNQIEMKPIVDHNTGRVTSYLPLPANWQLVSGMNGTTGFEGPNGIKVNAMPSESYVFNVDAYTAQMAGKQVANPISLETIFQDRLKPAIQQQGGKLLKTYALTKTAQRTQQLMQQSLNRSRLNSYTIIASEWQQPNGNVSLVLISQGVMETHGMGSWWVGLTELEAPKTHFEKAKETYLYALANFQVDQQTAMAHAGDLNRMDRESHRRMEDSRIAHERRMRDNETAFQNRQKLHNSTYQDISDISMNGYWKRNEMQDRNRQSEINMIHEEYTATNPWNNNAYQVPAGYKFYYMNNNGDVIGSNDFNFNPNIDKSYNQSKWRKMPVKNQ